MIETLRAGFRAVAGAAMAQDSAHDLAHLDRVWTSCQTIAAQDGGDLRVLVAAAYLHDLVNLPKDAPNRAEASRLAAHQALPYLAQAGYSEAEQTATAHAIEAHSFSADITSQTPEARILRDADRLDAIGPIGVARVFAVSGGLGRALYHPDDPFALCRDLDDTRYAIDHFAVKLLRLEADMLTDTGKRLAQDRTAHMVDFLNSLAMDIGHPAPTHWHPEALNA
ncbi:HD domain-containing protein [Pseudoprimorskyibacter insulae]|uniref:HD domain-containing protein n=1 Tax=Pseudoprimorskyibacter insulae TaxID=1695997 RepID=A0A2R8AV74_9RHOB|nr:HD domain-containing protein [Pseudoprimorskyibacter insulae]SPF79817.1 hypothetical protein PRI8871_01616 [Pseudoprimorskyibacter insulae]